MNKVRAAYKRLDYNNGDFLAHYRWKVMQDSVMFVWGLLQDDEDGMKIDNLAFVFYHPLAYYMNDNNLSKVVSDYISVSKVPLPDLYEKTYRSLH